MSSFITNSKAIRLRPRTYVTGALTIAVAWFAATMAANVLIDPQGVFGTHLRAHLNVNGRYAAFRAYQATPERYDAVLFASSRGEAFDRTLLAKRLEVRTVANFSVAFGLLTDHLPVLEFLLRDKVARGERLKAVFLVLDADFFGKQPWTNTNIDSFQPPQISGESAWRFWWRYLTAFQFKNWRKDLAGAQLSSGQPERIGFKLALAAFITMPSLQTMVKRLSPVAGTSIQELDTPEIRSDLARQLDLLTRFVSLCREHDVRLIIAFSPLNRQNVRDDLATDHERIVEKVARITPVWDFGRPAWLSDRPDLWYDFSHYSPAVAAMMIERIFGAKSSAPQDFGLLRTR